MVVSCNDNDLINLSIQIAPKSMNGGEYNEQLGQASRTQRYSEWG
jgi:hypothetical protein